MWMAESRRHKTRKCDYNKDLMTIYYYLKANKKQEEAWVPSTRPYHDTAISRLSHSQDIELAPDLHCSNLVLLDTNGFDHKLFVYVPDSRSKVVGQLPKIYLTVLRLGKLKQWPLRIPFRGECFEILPKTQL
jgi:hypothetical protein